jgi:hypothetical protein
MKALRYFAAALLVVGMVILFAFLGIMIGIYHMAYEEYSDFPAGPFFGLYCGGGVGLIVGIFLAFKTFFGKKVEHRSSIDTPPAEPYVYREALPGSSLCPPRRVCDFDVNGSNVVGPDQADAAWIIYSPGRSTDGDACFVYWDTGKEQWLWKPVGYGPYAPVNDVLTEEMAMVLLVYFDLLKNSGEYPPQRLQFMSPERLQHAGSGPDRNGVSKE